MEIKHMSQLWIRQISELLWDITMTPKTAFAPSKAELHLQGCSFWRHLPAGWVLQHPSPQGCSSTPVQLLSRELVPSENKRGASLRTTAQRWGGKHSLCASPVWRRAGLVWEGSQANSKAKQYVRTKGSIYFKRRLAAWKAFLICLYLFGTLNGWLQPVKYISVSEALLSSKTNSFIAQCFKLSIFFFCFRVKKN